MKKYIMLIALYIGLPCSLHAGLYKEQLKAMIAKKYGDIYNNNNYVSDDRTLTAEQVRNYLEQVLDDIAYAWHSYIEERELTTIRKLLYTAIRNYAGITSWTGSTRYKKDLIDQYIKSAIIEYIEERSYTYAYKKLHDNAKAKKIAESMRNNAIARMQKSSRLDFASLTPFIGSILAQAIKDALIAQQNNNNQYNSATLYRSESCCICLESFDDPRIKRIFLMPCGHDICKACARSWFFAESAQTCPQCRTKIDREHLATYLR
jgi:hypothetical protein